MIQMIGQIINFAGQLIMQIWNIPIIGNLTLGITLSIIIIVWLIITLFMGRKGD